MDFHKRQNRNNRVFDANLKQKTNNNLTNIRWMAATAVFILLLIPGSQTYSAPTILYQTDFETDPGWVVNPTGTDTASSGFWEVADPEQTENGGFILQLESAASGSKALVTDGDAGGSVGENDVDGGVTSVRSPDIVLPNVLGLELSFNYYFGHNASASANDYLRVSVVGSTTGVVLSEVGDLDHRGAVWTNVTTSLDAYGGETIYILVEIEDDVAIGSLIEGGIDDVLVQSFATTPQITDPGDIFAIEDEVTTIDIEASDPNGDPLTYTQSGLPAGFTIDFDTGEINGTLAMEDSDTYTVTIKVSDGVESDDTTFNLIGIPRSSEAGSVTVSQTDADQWHMINLQYVYKTAVVVMGPPSFGDSDPTTIRVRNVTNSSFEFQIDEWDYLDGKHGSETIGYIVAEAGAFTLNSGTQLLAGIETGVTNDFTTVSFPQTFTTIPLVFAQIGSINETSAVAPRMMSILTNQFDVRVQEQEIGGTHAGEDIHWIALEAQVESGNFEGGSTTEIVDENIDTINFAQTYMSPPIFVATSQTYSGSDPMYIRHTALTASNVGVFVEEEQSDDTEVGHVNENIAYLVIEPAIREKPFGQAPNEAPVVTNPSNQTNQIGDSVSLQIQATDPNDDPLTYEATGLPTGLAIDLNSGLISGTVSTISTYAVEVTVNDDRNGTTSILFSWTVTEIPNNPPTISNPGDQANILNDSINLTISASDADNDPLTFSAQNLPAGLSIDEDSGLISGTVTAVGSFATVVTVTDGQDSVDAVFSWTVNEPPNTAPSITNPGDQENIIGDPISLTISASDADGDDLTFSANSLPAGLSINVESGLISGTLTAVDSYAVVVTVDDGEDSSNVVFSWVVNLPPNALPVVTIPEDQVGTINDSVNLQIEATDADNDTLTYSAENLPTGLSIDSNSGLISGTLTVINSYAVVVTVDDGRDPVTAVFAWTVNDIPNTAPNVTDPGDQSNNLDDIVNLQIEATDVDGDTLTFLAEGLPPGISIDEESGLITGTPTESGSFAVIVTADDGNSGDTTVVFAWTVSVLPNSPPVITDPNDQTNEVGDTVSVPIEAVDADADDLVYTAVNLPPGATINEDSGLISGILTQSGRYAILILVEDENGDSDNAIFNWIINQAGSNNNIPVIVNPPTQSNTIGDSVTLAIEASDSDGDPLTYSAASLPDGLTIDTDTGEISGTLTLANTYATVITVNDGNDEASTVFIWVVNAVPNIVPDIIEPDDQENIVGDVISLDIEATDVDEDELVYSALNLPPGLTIRPIDGLISGELTEAGQYAVIVTVDDGKGGIINATFLWVVNATANTGPSITDPGNQTNIINDAINLTIEASDPDADPLTYSAINLPTGTSIDEETGAVSGTATTIGLFPVSISVDDGRGGIATTSFVWSITAVPNNLPNVDVPETQFNIEGDTVSLQISATDDDGDSLLYIASKLPAGVSINPNSGLISGQLTKKGTHLVEIAVFDGQDTVEITFIWQVDEPENPFGINIVYLPITMRDFRPDEPNDVCADAATLLPNAARSFAHEDLEDWYVFSIDQNEAITIQLTNFTAGGQMIAYSGSCSNLNFLQNNGNFSTTKILNLGLSTAGTYYIRIITDDSYNDPTLYQLEVIVP